jgi:hypothetical protein
MAELCVERIPLRLAFAQKKGHGDVCRKAFLFGKPRPAAFYFGLLPDGLLRLASGGVDTWSASVRPAFPQVCSSFPGELPIAILDQVEFFLGQFLQIQQ